MLYPQREWRPAVTCAVCESSSCHLAHQDHSCGRYSCRATTLCLQKQSITFTVSFYCVTTSLCLIYQAHSQPVCAMVCLKRSRHAATRPHQTVRKFRTCQSEYCMPLTKWCMQVIVPAALCCSLTAVQLVSLLLRHAPPLKSEKYDPGDAIRTNNAWFMYLTTCAVPHSAAGPLAAAAIIASCAVWPTPLNAVAAVTLLNRVRTWALEDPIEATGPPQHPVSSPQSPRSPTSNAPLLPSALDPDSLHSNIAGEHAPPRSECSPRDPSLPDESRFAPFLQAHEAELLAGWVAFQIMFCFVLQMPMLETVAKCSLLKWAHIGIIAESQSLQEGILIAMHAALLAALFLLLTAVRCAADPRTRVWPKRSQFASLVAEVLEELPGQSHGSRLAAVGNSVQHTASMGVDGAQPPGERLRAVGGTASGTYLPRPTSSSLFVALV